MKQQKQQESPFTNILWNIPVHFWSLINRWYFLATTLTLSLLITYLNQSHRHTSIFEDLTNGIPKRGDLGLGRFEIYGVTFPFEYPFRLASRTLWGSLTPWLCYIVHQSAQFWVLTQARRAKERGELEWTGDGEWNPYAWLMFRINVVAVVVHYLQTYFFYDGLAATFPEISTLFAGVSSILIAFIVDGKRRGFILTWSPTSPSYLSFSTFMRSYHGYLASFGIVLTFWYHTMECTYAHLTGFIHIFLLLWQSSLIYQRAHKDRYWTTMLEVWIILHAVVVSKYQQEIVLNKMFLSSFLLLFLLTPVWGLPVVKRFVDGGKGRERFWAVLVGLVVVYALGVVYPLYKDEKPWLIFSILGLPMLYYPLVGYYFGCFVAGRKLLKWLEERKIFSQGSQGWYYIAIGCCFMTMAVLLGLAEFVYRQFVPYHDFKQ